MDATTPTGSTSIPMERSVTNESTSSRKSRYVLLENDDAFPSAYNPSNFPTTEVSLGDFKPKAKRKTKKTQKPRQPVTPNGASDGSDFDFASAKRSLAELKISSPNSSGATSPYLRPSARSSGITAMRLQLDALNLDSLGRSRTVSRSRSRSKVTSTALSQASMSPSDDDRGYDSEPLEATDYDVGLANDFISIEAAQVEAENDPTAMPMDDVHKKMCAADFEPLSCLGTGSFGTVYLVKHIATGRLYAQKMLRKATLKVRASMVEQTKTERAILESVNRHPFVVKLYYAFQDKEKLYLILEYGQGGELFHHLGHCNNFPETTVSFYMAEMVLALHHLHENVGVVYRDLKPENCLLDAEGHLLLTDFGLSKVRADEDDHCKSLVGTYSYMAPETVLEKPYSFAVDWWSLGAVGYHLLTGSPPFEASSITKIFERITKGKPNMPYYLGPDAKDLLLRLLKKDPKKRLGGNMPKDLATIKGHRFFRNIDWKLLEKRALDPPIKPMITDPELAENFDPCFTGMPLSPVVARSGAFSTMSPSDPFGGFSFVAPSSLLNDRQFLK